MVGPRLSLSLASQAPSGLLLWLTFSTPPWFMSFSAENGVAEWNKVGEIPKTLRFFRDMYVFEAQPQRLEKSWDKISRMVVTSFIKLPKLKKNIKLRQISCFQTISLSDAEAFRCECVCTGTYWLWASVHTHSSPLTTVHCPDLFFLLFCVHTGSKTHRHRPLPCEGDGASCCQCSPTPSKEIVRQQHTRKFFAGNPNSGQRVAARLNHC